MNQSARPSVIAARAPQRKQMPGLARQPATLIARRTAERVHHLGRRSAGAPEGKRLTHVPTPLRVMPRADSGEPAGAIFFAPFRRAAHRKSPTGGRGDRGFAGEAANPSLKHRPASVGFYVESPTQHRLHSAHKKRPRRRAGLGGHPHAPIEYQIGCTARGRLVVRENKV